MLLYPYKIRIFYVLIFIDTTNNPEQVWKQFYDNRSIHEKIGFLIESFLTPYFSNLYCLISPKKQNNSFTSLHKSCSSNQIKVFLLYLLSLYVSSILQFIKNQEISSIKICKSSKTAPKPT